MLEIRVENENIPRGSLYFDQSTLRNFARLAPSVISISERFQPERRRVEAFIEEVFASAYGATITAHYPVLMSVRNADDEILAAVGFRSAARGPLFLEQYLGSPVEESLGAEFGGDVRRDQVVEIGSLASTGSGASLFLIIALVAYLRQQGYEYPVVTATKALRSGFRFMGLSARDLVPAQKSALADGGAVWGSYYDTEPRVLTGTLSATLERLERYIPHAENRDMARLFTRIHPDLSGSIQ